MRNTQVTHGHNSYKLLHPVTAKENLMIYDLFLCIIIPNIPLKKKFALKRGSLFNGF